MITREVTRIAEGAYQVSDFRLDNYYLVVGTERAALIDCGCGLGDPMEEIREITDLPVTLIITHGHADHCGNAYHFEDVRMHPADAGVAKSMWGRDFVEFYVTTRGPARNPGEGNVEAMLGLIPDEVPDGFDFTPLADGELFDLGGGRVLKIVATPGHTPGSVSVLDREARLMFTGDALNASSIIPNKEGGTRAEIQEFRASLQRLLDRSGEFDYTCPGHDGVTYDLSLVRDFAALCDGLLDGSLAGDYEEVGIRKGRVVRLGLAELWYEADA